MSQLTKKDPLPEDFDLATIMRQQTGNTSIPSPGQSQSDIQASESLEVTESVPVEPPPKPRRRSRKKLPESEVVSGTSSPSGAYTWKRCTFICDKGISEKLHDIARIEGHPVSAVMQLMLKRGIEIYEKKHGKVKHSEKSLDDLL